jgi:hypothetical protein
LETISHFRIIPGLENATPDVYPTVLEPAGNETEPGFAKQVWPTDGHGFTHRGIAATKKIFSPQRHGEKSRIKI